MEPIPNDAKYVRYNISGNIFEVPAKYKPPIMTLGSGGYGLVCSAVNSESNETVAIKKIMHACENPIQAKRTLREIKLLRHLEHENIVGIKDIIVPPQRDFFEDVYIAFEMMDSDLYKVITSYEKLTKDHYQYFLYQILRGLKYIHSANVLHRDLKPSNLLVSVKCELKICDFGLARAASETCAMTEYVTTRWYRAPELLLNSSTYTTAIDMWSVGCIFLELMTGRPLFPGRDHVHQFCLILELIGSPTEYDIGSLNDSAKQYLRQLPWFDRQSFYLKFPNVPYSAIDLVEKMLKFDPRQRISVEDALAHPFLETLHDITDEPVCTKPFDVDLEEHPLAVEQIKELIYQEALAFNAVQQQLKRKSDFAL
ncbi:PREDICTED: mitogen-activated protein kinase homolog D5-like [Brassica oleracea var. oleracea]|uniref:mitogen-activated protein kinase homolog D5-like n=1 Tax=Brassica oleracea var. oleracea TaxID=109376 RepID=UPI0006A717A4|nr:PREDICTED: mitogen-activated protein kinase homolog D5-like [Brassica oleracea var. oleracea]